MENWLKVLIILFVVVAYVLLINVFSSLISFSYEQEKITEKGVLIGVRFIEISFSESVSVSVTRNRWYGNIYESNGKAYLYLLGLIKLPHKINNYNFIWFHIIFLINLSLFSVLIFMKRRIYKSENPNLEYEKMGEVNTNSN